MYSVRNWLWEAFVYTAMVNYPTEANFMMPLPAYPVHEVRLYCKFIASTKTFQILFSVSSNNNFSILNEDVQDYRWNLTRSYQA